MTSITGQELPDAGHIRVALCPEPDCGHARMNWLKKTGQWICPTHGVWDTTFAGVNLGSEFEYVELVFTDLGEWVTVDEYMGKCELITLDIPLPLRHVSVGNVIHTAPCTFRCTCGNDCKG